MHIRPNRGQDRAELKWNHTRFAAAWLLAMSLCGASSSFAQAPTMPDIDTSGGADGIVEIPTTAPAVVTGLFSKYTKVVAPNGKPVHIVAMSGVSTDAIVHARDVLTQHLTDVAGTQYGGDKSAVFNKMADNGTMLAIFMDEASKETTAADAFMGAGFHAQDLQFDEIFIEGSAGYMNNDGGSSGGRDASYEEILHLVHDNGIRTSPDTPSDVDPAPFQAEIRAAADEAIAKMGSTPGRFVTNADWKAEDSETQEYLAICLEAYFGIWAHDPNGNGTSGGEEYYANSRGSVRSGDSAGAALLEKFFSPFHTYVARIDPSFSGTFSLSFDASKAYTHKSRYLQHARLRGTNASSLVGNGRNNRLTGNDAANSLTGGAGDDELDGGGGDDTAMFTGLRSDYAISRDGAIVTVADTVSGRDGTDRLTSIENLKFSDQTVVTATLP